MREISKEEYFAIYKANKEQLCVHASYTDISGNDYYWSTGEPQWMTEWGFRDSEKPIIRAETKVLDGEQYHQYFTSL